MLENKYKSLVALFIVVIMLVSMAVNLNAVTDYKDTYSIFGIMQSNLEFYDWTWGPSGIVGTQIDFCYSGSKISALVNVIKYPAGGSVYSDSGYAIGHTSFHIPYWYFNSYGS